MSDGGLGCGKTSTWPVCSKASGHSAQGVCDLSGNVWEWVQDSYGPYSASAVSDPQVERGDGRVLRGGSWGLNLSDHLRAALRSHYAPDYRNLTVGFRCARTI
jgi:formylglycine-generating enzyme required for sulfatase activity